MDLSSKILEVANITGNLCTAIFSCFPKSVNKCRLVLQNLNWVLNDKQEQCGAIISNSTIFKCIS